MGGARAVAHAAPARAATPACPRAREPGIADILAILQTESSRLKSGNRGRLSELQVKSGKPS